MIIQRGWPRGFWIEDQRLVTLSGPDLQATPLAGGPTQTLLHVKALEPTDAFHVGFALDSQSLYWATKTGDLGSEVYSVWRASRHGGVEEVLAELPVDPHEGGIDTIVPLDDQLIAYGSGVFTRWVWNVGTSGRWSHQVTAPTGDRPSLFGIGEGGALLWRTSGTEYYGPRPHQGYLVSRSPGPGKAPEPFWTDKPPSVFPQVAWSRGKNGDDGWLVTAWEMGTDQELHATLWSLNRLGDSKRLACDPEKQGLIRGGALGPDGLYTPVEYGDQSWQILHFPLER